MNGSKQKRQQQPKEDGTGNRIANQEEKELVGFALGGLGGNNAHGAGFLQAAMKKGVIPDMISCTSGQIYWVSRYLLCLKAHEEWDNSVPDLRAILQRDIEESQPWPLQDANCGKLFLFGRKGVCEPAFPELFVQGLRNGAEAAGRIFLDCWRHRKPFLMRGITDLPGAHYLNPAFSKEFFEQVAKELQESKIGIAFNSYNPTEGHEYVYLNEAARKLVKVQPSDAEHYEAGQESTLSKRRVYDDIDARAVRRGLWLYWYGLSEEMDPHLDGAYLRQIMLSELAFAKTVYVVRPFHSHWSGDLPTSWTSLEDLKTKMSFNGAYMAERCQIELMNKLLEDEKVDKKKYHHVTIEEIEMDRPRGFYDYAFEDIRVFDEAFEKSMAKLPGRRGRSRNLAQADRTDNPQEAAPGSVRIEEVLLRSARVAM